MSNIAVCGDGYNIPLNLITRLSAMNTTSQTGVSHAGDHDYDVWDDPPEDDPTPPDPADPPDTYPKRAFSLFSCFEFDGHMVEIATYPDDGFYSGQSLFQYSMASSSDGVVFTVKDYYTETSVNLPVLPYGKVATLLTWKGTQMTVRLWGGGAIDSVGSARLPIEVTFEVAKIIAGRHRIEELELSYSGEPLDFWNTYQRFYLEDAVDLSEPLVNIKPLKCRHDHYPDKVGVGIQVLSLNGYHELFSPQLDIYNSPPVYVLSTVHNLFSENTPVLVNIVAADCENLHYAEEIEPFTSTGVTAADTYHLHYAEKVTIPKLEYSVLPDSTFHEMFDNLQNGPRLTERVTVDVRTTYHKNISDGDMVIGCDGDTVYAVDSYHDQLAGESSVVIRETVTARNCVQILTSNYIDTLHHVYNIAADSCCCNLFSDVVSPDFIRAQSCSHGLMSDDVWNFVDWSSHQLTSDSVAVTPHVFVYSGCHRFKPQPDIELKITPLVAKCFHSLFVKDTVNPDSTHYSLVSTEILSNQGYRWINV